MTQRATRVYPFPPRPESKTVKEQESPFRRFLRQWMEQPPSLLAFVAICKVAMAVSVKRPIDSTISGLVGFALLPSSIDQTAAIIVDNALHGTKDKAVEEILDLYERLLRVSDANGVLTHTAHLMLKAIR